MKIVFTFSLISVHTFICSQIYSAQIQPFAVQDDNIA